MNKLQAIIGDYEVNDAGFDFSDFVQMDHICYRVPTVEKYQTKKEELLTIGKFLGETQVNGRSISTFRLYNPIHYDRWRVDAIKLI